LEEKNFVNTVVPKTSKDKDHLPIMHFDLISLREQARGNRCCKLVNTKTLVIIRRKRERKSRRRNTVQTPQHSSEANQESSSLIQQCYNGAPAPTNQYLDMCY
jgi:hypothetical protein